MSKLSNTILMLSYLQNGKKYSIRELAERLEVTPRMIPILSQKVSAYVKISLLEFTTINVQ